MLDLFQEIVLKSTSLSKFGKMVTKRNGTQELYTPGCIRDVKNPCTGSKRIKETQEFKSIEAEFDEKLKEYKDHGRTLLNRIAQLEVDTRIDLLKEHFCLTVGKLGRITLMAEKHKARINGETREYTMADDFLAWSAGASFIGALGDSELKALRFDTVENFKSYYHNVRKETAKVRSEGNSQQSADHILMAEKVKSYLAELIPKMTFDVWGAVRQDEYLRLVNTETLIIETNKAQGQLNETTGNIITQNPNVDQTTLGEFLAEERNKMRKELNNFKKEMRSNSSAARKNHRSAGKSNGQNSDSSSDEDSPHASNRSRKNRRKGKKKNPQKEKKSNQKEKKSNQKSNQKSRKSAKRGREDQGESASGRPEESAVEAVRI